MQIHSLENRAINHAIITRNFNHKISRTVDCLVAPYIFADIFPFALSLSRYLNNKHLSITCVNGLHVYAIRTCIVGVSINLLFL